MIPKIFHRVWIGAPNLEADSFWSNSKLVHKDWDHYSYSEDSLDRFPISRELSSYCRVPAYVSDVIRLEALYIFGGFYVDADVEIIKSFDSLTKNDCIVVGWEDRTESAIGSAVIGAPARNKEILKLLTYTKEIIKKDSVNNKIEHHQLQRYFLPNLMTRLWADQNNILKMPRECFFPYDIGEKEEKRNYDFSLNEGTFSVHHWNLSWIEDPNNLKKPKYGKF
jgi:hypothetical protein